MSTVVSCGPRPHEGHRGWRVHSGFLRPQATRGTQRMARAQWFPVAPGHTRDTEDGVCSGFLWPQAVQRTQRMACAQWFPVAPRPYEGHRGHRWTPVLHWTELQERNTEPGNPRLFNTKSTTLLFVLKGDITSPVTVAYCKHNWKNCVGLEWSEPCIVDCLPQQYMSLARLRFLHEYPILSKFSKPGFSNMWTVNFQMFKLVLEKAEEPEVKLPTSHGSSKKQQSSRKTSISALLTMPKPLTVWITINCGKLWKRWVYQITWPASWEIWMQVRKQQLELDMEQQTGS